MIGQIKVVLFALLWTIFYKYEKPTQYCQSVTRKKREPSSDEKSRHYPHLAQRPLTIRCPSQTNRFCSKKAPAALLILFFLRCLAIHQCGQCRIPLPTLLLRGEDHGISCCTERRFGTFFVSVTVLRAPQRIRNLSSHIHIDLRLDAEIIKLGLSRWLAWFLWIT